MKYRMLAGIALVAALAALAGCAGPGAGVSAASSTPESPELPEPIPTPPPNNGAGELSGEVTAALLSIRDAAPTMYPDNYAGIATGTADSKDVLVIYLADSTSEVEAALRALANLPDDKIHFEPAYHSLEAAQRIDREIAAAVDVLRAKGIELQTYGVGVDGVEDIGINHPTDEQVAYLFDAYGPYLRIDRNVAPARLL